MKSYILLAAGLALILMAQSAHGQATPEARAAALTAIRQAAAGRGDVDAVNGKIAAARALRGAAGFDRDLARLEELTTYALVLGLQLAPGQSATLLAIETAGR